MCISLPFKFLSALTLKVNLLLEAVSINRFPLFSLLYISSFYTMKVTLMLNLYDGNKHKYQLWIPASHLYNAVAWDKILQLFFALASFMVTGGTNRILHHGIIVLIK